MSEPSSCLNRLLSFLLSFLPLQFILGYLIYDVDIDWQEEGDKLCNTTFLLFLWKTVIPTICRTVALALGFRLIRILMVGRGVNLLLA